MSKGLSWSCPARNHQVCSARNHQVCSVELGPGELSSILGNRGLNLLGPFGLKAHIPRKDSCIHGLPDISRDAPADRESDSALEELLSGNTLADQSSRGMLFVLGYIFSCIFDSFLGQMRSNNLLGCSFGRPHAGAPS